MSRLNVLFVPGWYPSPDIEDDVVGTFCREHARAAALFDNVALLATARRNHPWFPGKWRYVLDKGVPTFYTYCGDSGLPRAAWPFWHGLLRWAISRVAAEWRAPDVIYTQDEFACHVIKAMWGTGIPVVMAQHASSFGMGELSPRMRGEYEYAFKRARRVLPADPFAGSHYEHHGLRADVTWMPNAVDTSVFHPPTSGQREPWILHVSQFAPVKRVPDILEAFERVRRARSDAQLHLVGDDGAHPEIRRLAKRLLPPESYHFHGRLPQPLVADLMRRSRGLVHPSEFETFGCVLAEALFCDTPVVTTRVGGIPEVVPLGSGVFVEVGNIAQIAAGMIECLDGTHGISTEQAGRVARSRFSHEAVGRAIHDVCEAVTSPAPASRRE